MSKKNKIYIIITGVTAITLIWLGQGNKRQNQEVKLPSKEEPADESVSQPVNTLEGTLWTSDNMAKGNLMLTNSYATIYIKTTRDFNNLVGKNVVVTVNGTIDNFTLLSVEEILAKDGFIKIQ